MTPDIFNLIAITPAMALLPGKMNSQAARAMILAICLQESDLRHRHQIKGPAKSFAQFEMNGGIRGVLKHPSTRIHIQTVLGILGYDFEISTSYTAIEHNDILCVAFTRLLLYTLPYPLPGPGECEEGWQQYLSAWKPGKPRPETWPAYFTQAWEAVLNA